MDNYLLSKQDRATLQYKVTTKLREVILKGEFKMGERLIQEEWATKLGVSRMPIREALQQLEVEGLVRNEPRRGAIVTPISTSDIEEIYQLRALLEGEAVERSLPFLTEQDKLQLEKLHIKMNGLKNTEKDIEEYLKLNTQFHKLIRERCQWKRIHSMIDTLLKGIPLQTPSLFNQTEDRKQEHGMMIEYIKKNDAKKLKECMQKHILRTKDNLIKMVDNSNANEG